MGVFQIKVYYTRRFLSEKQRLMTMNNFILLASTHDSFSLMSLDKKCQRIKWKQYVDVISRYALFVLIAVSLLRKVMFRMCAFSVASLPFESRHCGAIKCGAFERAGLVVHFATFIGSRVLATNTSITLPRESSVSVSTNLLREYENVF